MPGMNFVLDKGYQVQSAVTKFFVVKYGTADQTCTAITGANQVPLGVAQEDASAADVTKGRIINVREMGIARCVAGGAITRGTRVGVGATGKVLAMVGTAGLVENVVGIAQYSVTTDGDHVDVLLTIGTAVNTAVS
jgi:hypothetical protein